jgi:hypothetical protein
MKRYIVDRQEAGQYLLLGEDGDRLLLSPHQINGCVHEGAVIDQSEDGAFFVNPEAEHSLRQETKHALGRLFQRRKDS